MKKVTIKNYIMLLLIASFLMSCSNSPTEANEETLIGYWQVEAIQEESIMAKTKINLIFNQEFKLSGKASCNNLASNYTQSDNSLTFGPVITTRKMCVPKVMEQESKLLNALTRVKRFQLKDGQLFLLDQTGSGQIYAVRKIL